VHNESRNGNFFVIECAGQQRVIGSLAEFSLIAAKSDW
jgi:hypothetical protein